MADTKTVIAEAKDKILHWFAIGQVGASSRAMALCLINEENDHSYPLDPSDFNRCLLFLHAVPEARKCFDKFRKMSPQWEILIDNWSEIEKSFIKEVGFNWGAGHRAPKTYKLMNDLLTQPNNA